MNRIGMGLSVFEVKEKKLENIFVSVLALSQGFV